MYSLNARVYIYIERADNITLVQMYETLQSCVIFVSERISGNRGCSNH